MGTLMMDSTGWPYDSFDCLLYRIHYSWTPEIYLMLPMTKKGSLKSTQGPF